MGAFYSRRGTLPPERRARPSELTALVGFVQLTDPGREPSVVHLADQRVWPVFEGDDERDESLLITLCGQRFEKGTVGIPERAAEPPCPMCLHVFTGI